MSARAWHQPLEFGDEDGHVRILEDVGPEDLAGEITRRLGRKATEDDIYLGAARAAVRSTRYEGLGSGHVPHGLFMIRAHRDLGSKLPLDLRPYPLVAACRQIHSEIHDPLFGPTRLCSFQPYAEGSREEIRDSYLDGVRFGDTDIADHIFAWLFKNLTPEEVADLLWTGGLYGVATSSFKLTGATEVFQLLQGLGWHHGEILLRGVVRHQAHRLAGSNPFEEVRDRIAAEGLLQKARRRLPGERGRGEDDPSGIWRVAVQWASMSPEERTDLGVRMLSGEWTLEDYWEAIMLGASILFLGASTVTPSVLRATQIVVAVHGQRNMIRHGGLNQKLLASLLAGRTPEFAHVEPAWVEQGIRLLEGALRASRMSADQLGPSLEGWQADASLGCVAAASADPAALTSILPVLDHRFAFLHGLEGLGPAFHLAQCEAFQAGRSPHRWVHLGCCAWLCSVWPGRGLLEERPLAELADRRRRSLARERRGR
jgi:hypothetical protein